MKTSLHYSLHALQQQQNRTVATCFQHDFLLRCMEERLLERLEFMRLAPAVIVEIGPGSSAAMLSGRFPNALRVACDVSHALLKRYRQRDNQQASALQCSPFRLPFADNSVDCLVSNCRFHWSLDANALLQDCHRVLKPGGLLLFSVLGPETLKQLKMAWASVSNTAHVNDFADMHEWGDALVKAGYFEPVVDRQLLDVTYMDVQTALDDLKGMGSHNWLIDRAKGLTTPRQLQRLASELESFRDADQRLPMTYELIFAQAWVLDKATYAAEGGQTVKIPLQAIPIRRRD